MTKWAKDDPRRQQARASKEEGIAAARDWLNVADIQVMLEFAVSDFGFVDVLDDFGSEPSEGHAGLPSSNDPHFSDAFYKQVKGWIFHKILTSQKERRSTARQTA